MKKNLFFGLFATMVLLLTTGCQQDEVFVDGNATVTFKVSTPEMVTRAYSDGTMAKNLQYHVYLDQNGSLTYLNNLDGTATMEDNGATVSIDLATGKTYYVLFWAAADGAPYTVDPTTHTMTVNYNGALNNDEKRDAFYSWDTIQVNNNEPQDVKLLRPFAQLNIGTDDIDEAVKAGLDITQIGVTVSKVYTTLNFADGSVDGLTTVPVVFGKADRPENETFPVQPDTYKYLAMNYLLVSSTKSIADVEMSYDDQKRTYTNIPLQRNHRTNIYGSLLTKGIGFNVEIDNRFDNEDDMTNVTVFSAQDLQAALDAAPANATTVITLGANIEANVTDIQKPGRKVVIEGNGNKYNGTIKVHSNSNYYDDAALTIKNVNFETSTASENFIEALENGSERYSSNITVENCTFTATDEAVNTAVGVQVKATRGVTVKNCTATNMHSLIQAQSCDTGDVKVIDSTINGKNGVAFKQVKSATVEGTTITAAEYGIRFDGNIDKYGIVVKNNNVTAVQPFIVRKMTGKDNTITLEGQNTLTTEAEYQIVITNGSDDEAYVKPTGTYTLTGAEGYTIFPAAFPVASWDEFTAALAAGEDWIKLTDNISNTTSYSICQDVIIDLNGKTLEIIEPTQRLNIGNKNNSTTPKPNVTIKNGNINSKVYAQTGNVLLSDINFGGTIAYTGDAQGVITVGQANLLAERCDMKNVKANAADSRPRALSTEGCSNGYLILRDCNFPSAGDGTGIWVASKLLRSYINPLSGSAQLELTNCKFGVAANIDLAASYVWTNMELTGCSGGFTFTVSRSKDSLTEEETAIMKAIKQNNSGTIKAYYNGTLVTY